jgi:hypothetical protein
MGAVKKSSARTPRVSQRKGPFFERSNGRAGASGRARPARLRGELQGAGECPGSHGQMLRLATLGIAALERLGLAPSPASQSSLSASCAPARQDWIDFTRDHTEIPVFAGVYDARADVRPATHAHCFIGTGVWRHDMRTITPLTEEGIRWRRRLC